MSKIYKKCTPGRKNPPKRRLGGFTLMELLVVVLVIGILAGIALPQYQIAVDKARYAETVTLVTALAQAQERYYMANGEYTDDFSLLDISFPYSYAQTEEGEEGIFARGHKYYLSTDKKVNSGKYVYGKYVDADVLYLLYLNNSSVTRKRQCRSHGENSKRAEKICKSMGGVYGGKGPFDGKIYYLD